MKLRFKVNQGEALRRGIDCPKSTVTVDVTPSELTQEQRNLIADRLDGIDVCELTATKEGHKKAVCWPSSLCYEAAAQLDKIRNSLIEAHGPTFEDLMEAIERNQRDIDDYHKSVAAREAALAAAN